MIYIPNFFLPLDCFWTELNNKSEQKDSPPFLKLFGGSISALTIFP